MLRWIQLSRSRGRTRSVACASALLLAPLALPAYAAHEQAAALGGGGGGGSASGAAGVQELLEQARQLASARQLDAAAARFAQANRLARGRCAECLLGLARCYPGAAGLSLESAIGDTRHAIALLADPQALQRAYCQLGDLLLLRQGSNPNAEAEEAEAAYVKALDAWPYAQAEPLAGIAVARLRHERFAGAVEAASRAIMAGPGSEAALRARSTICWARQMGHLSREAAPLPPLPRSVAGPRPGATAETAPREEPRGILRVEGAVAKPVKLYTPPPVYTEMARRARLQGVVIVEAILDQDGCILQAHIAKGLPMGLDRAALEALRQWVFAPATLAGRPVKVYYTVTVNFQVD
jgi:TonB family protein